MTLKKYIMWNIFADGEQVDLVSAEQCYTKNSVKKYILSYPNIFGFEKNEDFTVVKGDFLPVEHITDFYTD